MKHAMTRWICRVAMAATVLVPLSGASAAMIPTEQAVSAAGARTERAMVAAVLERAEVARALHALGVDPAAARVRVDAMTDEDVHLLSGQVAALPAGGTGFGLAIVVAAIIAAVILYRYR